MQITVSIVKGSEDGTYNAKFGTSIGGGQTRIKDAPLDKISEALAKIVEDADKRGFVGKK